MMPFLTFILRAGNLLMIRSASLANLRPFCFLDAFSWPRFFISILLPQGAIFQYNSAAMNGKKIFVGMSGGVDSSVAAYLLKKQGHDVVGVFMRCWSGPSGVLGTSCPAERDAEDARRVAEKIGIPFYALDFEEEYKKRVVDYMVRGYKAGLTPNPDIMCNREIKFGLFLEKALAMGADYVATGHYVELKRDTKRARLYVAKDKNKDQSYFLWTLTQKQLACCLFPIGGYLKSEVRAIAKKADLPTAEKKDSQGICFLGQVTLEDFLKTYIPEKKGAVVTASGEVIGEHRGAHFYTIGQRHIGVNYKKKTSDAVPFYVAAKNVRENTVTVVPGRENPELFRSKLPLAEVSLISKDKIDGEIMARVRYRQPLSPAVLKIKKGSAEIIFREPQQFVAEGQSVVFYAPAKALAKAVSKIKRSSFAKATEDIERLG